MTASLVDLRAFLHVLREAGELLEIDDRSRPRPRSRRSAPPRDRGRRPRPAVPPRQGLAVARGDQPVWHRAPRQLAFGPRPEQFVQRLAALPHTMLPPSLGKLWQQRDLLGSLLKVGRKHVRRAPLLAGQDTPPRLSRLPLLRTWSEDGGPFVTLPLVYTEHPEGLGSNLGMYRIQRFSDDTTGLHMQIGKGGGFHLAEYERLGRAMPGHVHDRRPAGADPQCDRAAARERARSAARARSLLGQRLRSARSAHTPLPLFADAEFCLVGEVRPGERHPEGPFGDHYGYYSLQHDYPLLRCDTLLHRKDPILCATVVGKPRQEDFFLGDYLQDLLLPLAGLVAMPACVRPVVVRRDGLPRARGRRRAGTLRTRGDAERVPHPRRRPALLTKFLLLTDRAVDLRDFRPRCSTCSRAPTSAPTSTCSAACRWTRSTTPGPAVNKGSKGVLLGLGEPVRTLPSRVHGRTAAAVRARRSVLPRLPRRARPRIRHQRPRQHKRSRTCRARKLAPRRARRRRAPGRDVRR
jgi:UbiD family decarboxylase